MTVVTIDTLKACEILRAGGLVIMPTETVYGLAADAAQDLAVAGIYALKNRPRFNPLIVHVRALEAAEKYGHFNKQAYQLAEKFWPGPLTLIVPLRLPSSISALVTTGLTSVGLRVPSHPLALDLLRAYQKPLAAPSANRSSEISPTCAEAVRDCFGVDTPFILEGGRCAVGLESTMVDVSGDRPALLRPGGIPVESIEQVIGPILRESQDMPLKAPGMMKRHYAPHLPLRINATDIQEGEAYLSFGDKLKEKATLNLSVAGDLVEAAANLFAMLRQLDTPKYKGIAVSPIPDQGLGLAINDRLQRGGYRL